MGVAGSGREAQRVAALGGGRYRAGTGFRGHHVPAPVSVRAWPAHAPENDKRHLARVPVHPLTQQPPLPTHVAPAPPGAAVACVAHIVRAQVQVVWWGVGGSRPGGDDGMCERLKAACHPGSSQGHGKSQGTHAGAAAARNGSVAHPTCRTRVASTSRGPINARTAS